MLLTIAGVIAAVAVMNAVYPAITRSSSAVAAASGTVDERIRTNIKVVQSVGELDSASGNLDRGFGAPCSGVGIGEGRSVGIGEGGSVGIEAG